MTERVVNTHWSPPRQAWLMTALWRGWVDRRPFRPLFLSGGRKKAQILSIRYKQWPPSYLVCFAALRRVLIFVCHLGLYFANPILLPHRSWRALVVVMRHELFLFRHDGAAKRDGINPTPVARRGCCWGQGEMWAQDHHFHFVRREFWWLSGTARHQGAVVASKQMLWRLWYRLQMRSLKIAVVKDQRTWLLELTYFSKFS